MSRTIIKCLFLTVWFIHLDCEVYQDRPKIKTSDGDLIIEPAFDKNIYLLPNGPKSNIFVGEVNILKTNVPKEEEQNLPATNDNSNQYILVPNGILERLERLENQSAAFTNDLLNISSLWRRVNFLHRKVNNLQNQISTRARDECQSNPCQHGGTCLNLVNGYYCMCPLNWEGRDCDVDVNECRNFAGTDLGCQNGATCINRPGSYECMCRSGWFGLHCTRKKKDCSEGNFEMCGHGTCLQVNSGEGITCICDQGWTTNGTSGGACLTDINECDSQYLGNRCSVNPEVQCINLPGSFRCGPCPSGYEGDGFRCHDIDECITIPNGGCSPLVSCHNTIGSRICGSCPAGYQGDGITCSWRGSCNINRGGCHPSALCIDNGLATQCICPEGMDGNGVGLHGCYVPTDRNFSEPCQSNPCGIHGQCHTLRNGYTCICFKEFSGAHCDVPLNYCANNPCQNGGVCRQDDTLTRGYRCECTAQYTGPLCQIQSRTCGGVLDNGEGSIVYPLSNTSYSHNAKCLWVIHTTPDKVINVTFSKFNLEDSPDCPYDFLQIHDGRSSANQLIGRFCGSNYPKGGNIISSHNNLYFWFRSDGSVAKDGFALHWTSIAPVCGGEVDATTHGQISSPGSPGKYPPNRDCYWHLSTSLGKRIQLHFFVLDIETHPNCSYDHVSIYDGERTSDPLLSRYCNSTQPAPLESAGSDVLIHFHSDAYGSGNGFQIAFAPVQGVPGCGGFFTLDKGEISSPSFNGSYLNNLLCEYKIKTSPDTKIRLDFKTFAIEYAFRCKYDYLKIYDGPSADSRLVGKFCGHSYPKPFTSSTNQLYFKFKTDRTLKSEGFRISYEAVCQINIIGDSGIIKSPGYPFTYPENRICEYVISTTPGKAIQLTFQDFDVEDNRYFHCRYDNVEIRDGPNGNSTLFGRYCGGSAHTPPVQISTHNYMYIKFVSDMSVAGTGFYANYTTIDTECGGIYRETTGLINFPSGDKTTYNNNQNCSWMIIAPEGMHIKLTWNRFDIEQMPTCDSDYLEIIEVDYDNEEAVLGKYCGRNPPPAFTASTNRLKLRFESDSSVRSAGFSLSYSLLDEKSHCGGIFIKSHGVIYSPGWPKSYEPNRDCTWVITVPVGQQIKLNITDFDLERPIRDRCDLGDYLSIRNGATADTPLVGKFCGKFKSKYVVSLSNSLFLQFHSDFYLSGKGFKIEWDGTLTGCGGTLTGFTGTISSPNYPNNYNENAECFYRIITSHGSRLRISFTELELERTHRCKDDYVEIFDGRDVNTPSLGRHCTMGPELINIETSSNIAFIKFRSDFLVTRKGFLLNYNTICRTNVTGSYGVIESPGYPNNYKSNLNCSWTITVPKGNRINITYTHFDIFKPYGYSWWRRPITNCSQDYVQMKESTDVTYSDKQCGSAAPQPLTTRSNSLIIEFITSSYVPRSGFQLEWVSYGCGAHIQKQSGIVSLDKSLVTTEEMECEWLIETPVGTAVYLTFNEVFMADTKNCTNDALEIYNGQSIKSPLLSKICHRTTAWVQSTSNYMLVRFVKHSSLRDIQFKAYFESTNSICGGNINALSGFIYSKNYPKNYDNSMNCIWGIHVPMNHRIELNFMDLDLYSYSDYGEDEECGDFIKIYDSVSVSSNYTYRICPNSNTTQFISKFNTLVLQFITDSEGTAKGFKANFTVTCGATITALHSGIITNDNFVSHLSKNCSWTILAPSPDQKIYLTITHIALPQNNDLVTNRSCSSSFLRVFDGDDNNAPLVDEYCGRVAPPMIVSHGSAITIELGTYGDTIMGHFSAHYSPLTNACGGTLTSEEGTITSPNYPHSYPVNTDCEWILSTSPGNRVYITFVEFNLDYSDGCNEDYLEVRENDGGGKILGVYCGDQIPTNTTKATKIYMKFHTNNIDNERGFLLHYGFLHGSDISGQDSGVISSPLYPSMYVGSSDYSWRIITSGSEPITITIDRLEIHSYGDGCGNKLSIYDGYDGDAQLLEELCGLLSEQKVVATTSSAVYITLTTDQSNTGSIFHLRWEKSDMNVEEEDNINCGSNETELILPGKYNFITSPNYPENYDDNLHCEWTFKSIAGRHLQIYFHKFILEETSACFADSVSVYSADKPENWKTVIDNVCTLESVGLRINATNYMKLKFNTDSSVTKKGFRAQISSVCGGKISDLSGSFGPTWFDTHSGSILRFKLRCDWIIKVRPGRQIKFKFEHFNITNNDDNHCKYSVVLRNGDSIEAPMLGNGKYCGYSHESRDEMITSSNALFVSYIIDNGQPYGSFQNFIIQYEEQNVNCGGTLRLSPENSWEVINSPNYPSVPIPYLVCEWVIFGPPGEIIRVDFIDRFDIYRNEDCATEAVEIRDGSSGRSPLKGKFCHEKPGTVKTTNNVVYIKYLTERAEPNIGFKANVSIDVCGGTIVARNGEIISPGYPHMMAFPYGTNCEWRIIGNNRHVFQIKPEDIHLPVSEAPCDTKITIEEIVPANNTMTILKTYCNEDRYDTNMNLQPVQTSTNNMTIKLHIGKPSEWVQSSETRGFRFTFNSSVPECGGMITTPEGFLMTPSYPLETTLRYCHWLIKVPDESRRVRLEIMDIDTEKHRIGIFNDLSFQSAIQIIPGEDYTSGMKVFESTGHKLALYLWLNPLNMRHRFKAKFSSDEQALCGGNLRNVTGELVSPAMNRSYSCEWKYDSESDSSNNAAKYKSIYITAKTNSSVSRNRCGYSDPKISVVSYALDRGFTFIRDICGNVDVSYRIPLSVINFKAIKSKSSSFYFHVDWIAQPCGGIVVATENPNNIINIPSSYNGSLDCAWVIQAPFGESLELKLEGSFKLECEDEFIHVRRGLTTNSPILFEYCKEKMQELPVSTHFRHMYVEYHSNSKNNTNDIMLIAKVVSSQCGRYLSMYDRIFSSPNFPKSYKPNEECTWEIKADLGYRISLQFIERFVVEDHVNCTKDVVIIYDWKDDTYIEIARLCGRQLPLPYNSTYNKMKVVLRTDADINLDGFKVRWVPICGGTLKATETSQVLYSPGYPYEYPPVLDCSYEIIAPNENIFIKFDEFELEGSYPSCEFDNLTITAESNMHYFDSMYCGDKKPEITEYFIDKVSLVFKSDRYIQKKGFKLSYSIYTCGGKVRNETVLSSNHFESYANNADCTWIIEAPLNKIVVLKFNYIDLESNTECYNDYLAVYNGMTKDDNKRIALLCGRINSTTVLRSSNNTMVLNFVTDSSVTFKGFKVEVYFSYSETVGCGGIIDMTSVTTRTLKSPLIGNSPVYENYLDCFWEIRSAVDTFISIEFTSFHISPCRDVNQTAIGYNKCDCDLVEIKDGVNPNSLSIGTYCGHTFPPKLVSSRNTMSIRLSTNDEVASSGFEAQLTVRRSICGRSMFSLDFNAHNFKSPGYDSGSIPRGLHCFYHLGVSPYGYNNFRITIKYLDLQPATTDASGFKRCDKDKLIITSNSVSPNTTLGEDFILNQDTDTFITHSYRFDTASNNFPDRIELCGRGESIDLYVTGSVTMNLITSAESDSLVHKGVEIEAVFAGFCGRNYTESQGRIQSNFGDNIKDVSQRDCYTLITAPENSTVSIYFIVLYPSWGSNSFLDFYDGNNTNSPKLIRINSTYEDNYPIFSNSRYVLIHNHEVDVSASSYDLIYTTTGRGKGCGGKMNNIMGKVTSPLYPNIYRRETTCEWELETPIGTRIFLKFLNFDVSGNCDYNYLQLVDSKGKTISTFCSEEPADYTSTDNYVKIVYVTSRNNGGTGWNAEFTAVV